MDNRRRVQATTPLPRGPTFHIYVGVTALKAQDAAVAIIRPARSVGRRRWQRRLFIQICLVNLTPTQKRWLAPYCRSPGTCVSSFWRCPRSRAPIIGRPCCLAYGPHPCGSDARHAPRRACPLRCFARWRNSDSRGCFAFTASRTSHTRRPHLCVHTAQCECHCAA